MSCCPDFSAGCEGRSEYAALVGAAGFSWRKAAHGPCDGVDWGGRDVLRGLQGCSGTDHGARFHEGRALN